MFIMAGSQVIANGAARLCTKINLFQSQIKKLLPSQVCWISSKQMRDPNYKRAEPWPYETKKYTFLHGYLDNTLDRFDENTKVIVVDGNIAAGKSTFAESLANELDMKYFPEATMDRLYINDYGYDLRQLDSKLPPNCRSCDVKKFYEDPHFRRVAFFQIAMYELRFEQYLDAMTHLLNTGQGVVLDRSIYSDFVFMETMHKFGYLSKGVRNFYYEAKDNSIYELLRPHLVIYLDVPVPTVMERIKKRNIPFEVNSKVLTADYLSTLEYYYKQKFLKEISSHAELLIYDWSNYGDVDMVVEEIERIDFEKPQEEDGKFKDWNIKDKWKWNALRRRYGNEKLSLFKLFNIVRMDAPEMYMPAEDYNIYYHTIKNAPGEKYMKGFNSDLGDTGLLFKTKYNYRDIQRPTLIPY